MERYSCTLKTDLELQNLAYQLSSLQSSDRYKAISYGKPYDVHSFDSKYYNFNYDELQRVCKGANCLHAHEGSMLRNDEIIVYKEDQCTIRYLIELKN